MIYTITRKYNSEELVQLYDIVYEQDYLDIKKKNPPLCTPLVFLLAPSR